MSNTRHIIRRLAAPVIGSALALGLAAGPALASTTADPPPVPIGISIPQSMTLSLGAGSEGLTFTGSVGGPSTTTKTPSTSVAYTINSNSPTGYAVQVAAADANMVNGANSAYIFGVNTIAVWGPAQQHPDFAEAGGWGATVPSSLSTNSVTTDTSTGLAENATGIDYFGFVGPDVGTDYINAQSPLGGHGSNIPNVPAGHYANTVVYSALAR